MPKPKVEKVSSEKLVTPIFRVSYPVLKEPRGFRGADGMETNPQYSVMAVWDPKDFSSPVEQKRWAQLRSELDRIAKTAFKLPFEKLPASIKRGLREGLERPDDVGEDKFFASLSARPAYPPGVVDRNKEPLDPEEVYAGCFARATIVLYSFDNVGKGIGIGLRNIQKTADGPRLDGQVSAAEDFKDEDSELPKIEGAFDADDVSF